MLIEDLIIKLSDIIENKISQSILIGFQEYLLKAGIFTLASHILAVILIVYVLSIFLFMLFSLIFSINMVFSIVVAISIPTVTFVLILFMKIERRASEIENSIPDFLRQLGRCGNKDGKEFG